MPPEVPSAASSASGKSSSSYKRRPPTRRVIRHVLRARVEASKALASLFGQLERGGNAEEKRVCASVHLARAFGGQVEEELVSATETAEGIEAPAEPMGWRSAREVVDFLRKRGARITALEDRIEGDWAALSSDGEGDSDALLGEGDKDEDVVWVPSGLTP
ncbi:hypothetical protein AcW1_008633 [Taiwanofungus camphoratus]|nr:hypothetical protein AcV5_006652 [Antrodia cinnamomea]KAI0935448.1 hypothetical protein AcV7_003878 [Antrodia cinnamomea]KAI0948888.1 hypothetical protein AcW1_008633 [Antrodia cinnamomea]